MTDKEALKLALEALEGVLDDAPKVLDASIVGGLYEVVQCREAITAIKEALAQPEQELNKDGSPCPEFWDWLTKAYNFDGNGSFTKYNMEVAFLAGKQSAQPAQHEPVSPEPFGYFQYDIRLDAWVQNRINNKGVAFYTKEKK